MSGYLGCVDRLSPIDPHIIDEMETALACETIRVGDPQLGCVCIVSSRDRFVSVEYFDDGKSWVIFDGRIDNERDLRATLSGYGPALHGASNAEYIHQAFQEYGRELTRHILGDYVFVVWNSKTRELYSARDVPGGRRLFYTATSDRVYFASQIEPLVPIGGDKFDLDGFRNYLLDRVGCDERTIYSNIQRLLRGSHLIVDEKGVRQQRWYVPPKSGTLTYSSNVEYYNHFRSLLQTVVESQLRPTDRVGLLFSGGIDSASIAVCLRQAKEQNREAFESYNGFLINFLNVPFNEYREGLNTLCIAESVGIPKITVQAPAVASYLRVACSTPAEPALSHLLFGHHVAASESCIDHSVTTVMTGVYGDELFYSPMSYLYDLLTQHRYGMLVSEIYKLRRENVGLGKAIGHILYSHKSSMSSGRKHSYVRSPHTKSTSARRFDINQPLYDMILHEHDCSDIYAGNYYPKGLDVANPYVDRRMVDFSCSIPFHTKIAKQIDKPVIRYAFPDIALDSSVSNNCIGTWDSISASRSGIYAIWPEIVRLAAHPNSVLEELIDMNVFRAELPEVRGNYGGNLLLIIILGIWLEEHLSGSSTNVARPRIGV